MRRSGMTYKGALKTVPDENLIYNHNNITAPFPNANNVGIDSTGNVLTATSVNGTATSILKTQDSGEPDYIALTSDTIDFEGDYEYSNISKERQG